MNSTERVTAFAPATVGNVICGFDTLGLALEAPGDEVTAIRSRIPGVRIRSMTGITTGIPRDAERNSAGAAVAALLEAGAPEIGVELEVHKGLPLAAGMGGSAASAVAAVVAAEALLGTGASEEELLRFALEGEGTAAGQAHGDNAAPALLGGLVLVRPMGRRPVVRLPVPGGLSIALLRPHLEIATRDARAALGSTVPLESAVEQIGHVAAFVAGLYGEDWELISDALVDRIAEPHRAALIPAFHQVRSTAVGKGALGCGISGAGPSLFALCRDRRTAEIVGAGMASSFRSVATVDADLFVSGVSRSGARIVNGEQAEEVRP